MGNDEQSNPTFYVDVLLGIMLVVEIGRTGRLALCKIRPLYMWSFQFIFDIRRNRNM